MVGIIYVEGREHKVEYEGLDFICFNCGRFSHKQEACTPEIQTSPAQHAPLENQGNLSLEKIAQRICLAQNKLASPPPVAVAEGKKVGAWMVASNIRKPNPQKGRHDSRNQEHDPRSQKSIVGNNQYNALSDIHDENSG